MSQQFLTPNGLQSHVHAVKKSSGLRSSSLSRVCRSVKTARARLAPAAMTTGQPLPMLFSALFPKATGPPRVCHSVRRLADGGHQCRSQTRP